jgi:hypothetical protein
MAAISRARDLTPTPERLLQCMLLSRPSVGTTH